jgi:hypothetical protein
MAAGRSVFPDRSTGYLCHTRLDVYSWNFECPHSEPKEGVERPVNHIESSEAHRRHFQIAQVAPLPLRISYSDTRIWA